MPDTALKANGQNGGKFIDSIDPDDPEYQRQMMRPAEIKEDLTLMEQRKRVSLILKSDAFKLELEEIIKNQLKSGAQPASLAALQQISDLLIPGPYPGAQAPVLPINDIRSSDTAGYAKGERLMRCKLASYCRLIDTNNWADGISNHITARITPEHYLTTPLGLRHSEITSSCLVKIESNGELVQAGSSVFGADTSNWWLHSAALSGRPDARCVAELRTPGILAITSSKLGLLPVSIEACAVGEVGQCELTAMQDTDRAAVAEAASTGQVVFVRNCCALVIGASVEEVWFRTGMLIRGIDAQLACLRAYAVEDLVLASEDSIKQVRELTKIGGGGVNYKSSSEHKWRIGELEFEAEMRCLDAAGYRTGYAYHEPNFRQQRRLRRHEDVEIPPASSAVATETDESLPTKQVLASRGPHGEWLSTPNAYRREEIEEINTDNPKKITKWIRESESRSTPIKISNPNQFAPQGVDPKELRNQQRKVKDHYYKDHKDAGPQSRVMKDQLTPKEVQKLMDEGRAKAAADGSVVVGAASKGIIARQHQHNALVYQNYYSPNPFADITDDDLQKYEANVRRRKEGGTDVSDSDTDAPNASSVKAASQAGELPSIPEDSAATVPKHSAVASDSEAEVASVSQGAAQPKAATLQRHESDRLAEKQRQQVKDELSKKKGATIDRAQSQRAPGERAGTSARGDTLRSDTSGAEEDGSGEKKKKKKSGFRIPSFSSKKKDKKAK